MEGAKRLVRAHPTALGTVLRCRLHPEDCAQLFRDVEGLRLVTWQRGYSGPGGYSLGERVDSVLALPIGQVRIEVSPSYVRGVAALMAPNVMDAAGVRPASENVAIAECCDECGVLDEFSGLGACPRAPTGCRAWLCGACEVKHEELHTEALARVAKAPSRTLSDADFQMRMRQRRAAAHGEGDTDA